MFEQIKTGDNSYFIQNTDVKNCEAIVFAEATRKGKTMLQVIHYVLEEDDSDLELLCACETLREEIRKQYVLTARAKGLDERTVLWRHVFRNAMIPIMTGFPAAFVGAFFSGSLLIETLFSLDGLGLLSYESVMRRDYPVVLGSLFFFTLIGLFTTLLRDLSYLWVDPRVRYFD